jgi:hypothetical protein
MGTSVPTLDLVRHRLEALEGARLIGGLDPKEQEEYERLCAQEQVLLDRALSIAARA